ncbi:Holliday junction resolvase RuvX [Candidatus Daviesbacteria bacterium]|nr:Holliday junction resolvase RuvX [Candidatus Daviesbacteria bacterium]
MRYLGVDYGLKKIGLAISQGQLASIYKIVEVNSLTDAVSKISQIVKDENIDLVVVGMPEGKTLKIVKNFVNKLKFKNIEVETFDETLSSVNAKQLMINLNLSQKERRKEDAYAAALILQNFLDTLS